MKHYHLDEYIYDNENSKLFIRGWAFHKNYEVVVLADNKEIMRKKPNQYRFDICEEYASKEDKNNYGFEYTIKVKEKHKRIKVVLVTSKKKYTIFSSFIPTNKIEESIVKGNRVAKKIGKVAIRRNIQLLNPMLLRRYLISIAETKQYEKEEKEYVNPNNSFQYRSWALEKLKREKEDYHTFKYNPLISILVPVYNVPTIYLKACIDSVLQQKYENFELCIADDCSTDKEIKKVLKEYEKKDSRIKVAFRKENGHISKATNTALEMASGEFISLLDNDDVLTEDALYQVVKALNENDKLDLIYSDEDKMDLNGNLCFPSYKPDWSPELFSCYNYLCHFTTIRKKIVDKIGGFRVGYEGAQDYDIFLRVVSETNYNKIHHIPKILYHWRMIAGSTAAIMSNKSYAFDRGKRALQDYFDREKINCHVSRVKDLPYYYPKYKIDNDLVTIILENKNIKQELNIKKYSDYSNYEIINIESSLQETIEKAKGKYIILMDSNTYLNKSSSIKRLLEFASVNHIGVISPHLKVKNSYYVYSGIVLFNDHLEYIKYSMRQRISAIEPKLKIPVNYSASGDRIICFEKEKFLKSKGDLDIVNFPKTIDMLKINLCFRKNGYYNATDSSNEFLYKNKFKEEYDIKEYQELKIDKDPFYNINFSKTHMFKLDKFE